MRVLVTGAGGFIGSRLVRAVEPSHEVFALVRRTSALADHGARVEWIEHDLLMPPAAGMLPGEIDAVIHLAQSDRYRDFPGGAPDVFAVNVRATFELLEYALAAGASRFVFASTGGVYGYNYDRVLETHPVSPLNFYLSSKYAAELMIANYRALLDTVVVRPFFVYGPGQSRMLVPTLVEKVTTGTPVQIDGNPGLTINPIYVDDAVAAIAGALSSRGSGLFNLAGDESVTITALVDLIGELSGVEPIVEHRDNDPGGDLLGDNRRMKEVLGVTPQTSLRNGLSLVIGSHRDAAGRA
jgi:UDP-glucose 4-epimerase